MEKQIELSQEQIEELLSSSKNGKKSPNTLIMNGDIESLQALIDDGLDVNETNFSGAPLLALAIMYSDTDIVKLLIRNGADVNIVVQDRPLLVYALMFGDIEIIKLLVKNGADVNVSDNDTPLILQALAYGNNELVKLLIENEANIEFENNSSLLEQSLLFSNTEIAELCIEKGSKFPQHILVDFLKTFIILELTIDGYIFDRKNILNILDEKKKLHSELSGLLEANSGMIQDQEEHIARLNGIKIIYQIYKSKILDKNSEIDGLERELEKIKSNFSNEGDNKSFLLTEYKINNLKLSLKEIDERIKSCTTTKKSIHLNKLHKRLNKIRTNMTNMIYKINNIQDQMTVLTIIDFIKIFIKYGGDVNYKDENGSTVLIYLSYFGYEDCVKLLIDKGADMDIIDKQSHTALSMAYKNNKLPVVKLLIESGADVNITMDNGESFYKKAKHDKKLDVLEWIENSPTYIKITHDPIELVKILSNFTIDTPFKLTTHLWEDPKGELFDRYGSFDEYMNAVKKQFDDMKSELEELSPNLYKKIYTFLIETSPDEAYSWCSKTNINIGIGWSSLKGLKEHCDSGKLPKDFKLPKPIFIGRKQIATFGEIVDLFKQEIEVKATYHIASLPNVEFSKRDFYTDTQKFSTAIAKIFKQMKSEEYPQIEVSNKELLEDRSIEIKITQVGSPGDKNAESMLQEINDGDFADIKEALTNLCDWSIESSFEDESFRVNFLHSNNVKDIEILESKPKGFTHILRFYK